MKLSAATVYLNTIAGAATTISMMGLLLLPSVHAQGQMVKMCLFYDTPSGHARSDPIINQQCSSGHVHTVSYSPKQRS